MVTVAYESEKSLKTLYNLNKMKNVFACGAQEKQKRVEEPGRLICTKQRTEILHAGKTAPWRRAMKTFIAQI